MLLLSRLRKLAHRSSKRLGISPTNETPVAPKTDTTASKIKTLQDLLKDRAKSCGSVSILIYPAAVLISPFEVTYQSLLEQATEKSKILRSLNGFEVHKPVLLHFDDHWSNILWFWSVLLADGLPVLSSPLSNVAENREKHLQHLSELLESPLTLTASKLLPLFEGQNNLRMHAVESIGTERETPGTSHNLALSAPSPSNSNDDLAILMLTSGSTGNAKVVRLCHRQLLQSAKGKASVRQLPDKPFLNWIGLDHVAGLTEIHLKALWLGMPQIHVQASDVMSSPTVFLDLVSRHQVSRTFAPNFFLAKLAARVYDLRKTEPAARFEWDFSGLVILGSGGEGNDTQTCTAITDILVKHGAPQNVLMPGFGMTETCAGSIYNLDCPSYDIQQNHAFASLGKCMPGIEMRISPENGISSSSPVPPNTIGALEVSGPVVFDGYYRNPEATMQAFTPDGWFRTGDQAHMDANGNLNLVGRANDAININGVKFGISDLQTSLEQVMGTASVSRLVVFPSWVAKSRTEQVTVAYIPLSWPMSPETMVEYHDKMNRMCFMSTGSPISVFALPDDKLLPKTTLGKISKAQMKSLHEKGIFDEYIHTNNAAIASQRQSQQQQEQQKGHEIRETTEEESFLLNEIIQITANLDNDAAATRTISVNTPIFDLGFSSLDLIRLKNVVSSHFQITIPILTILKNPTARSLASSLFGPSTTTTTTAITDKDNPTTSSANEQYDPVVPLHLPPSTDNNNNNTKSPSPLWLIHPGVGEILVFLPLAQALSSPSPPDSKNPNPNRPIYALRARGFNQGETPFESIPETVSCYSRAIRRIQPSGPYAIAGYSYGGMLAFEVAKKLEAGGGGWGGFEEEEKVKGVVEREEEGEEIERKNRNKVSFLGILNLPPEIKHRMRYLTLPLCLLNLAYFLGLISEGVAEGLEDESRGLNFGDALQNVLSLASRERMEDELGLTPKQLGDWAVLASKLQGMARDYEPGGKVREGIDVFHAVPLKGVARDREEWVGKWLKGWEGFCEGGRGEGEEEEGKVKFHAVDGAHYTMLGPEFVGGFAERLRAVLRDRGV